MCVRVFVAKGKREANLNGMSPSHKVIMIPFIIVVIAIEIFSRPLTVILSKHLIYERNHSVNPRPYI